MVVEQQQKMRWAEIEEEDDNGNNLDYLLPPPVVVGPDADGIKKLIEYRFDKDGNKLKVTTTTRVLKFARMRVTKRAIERRSWAKFGDAATEDAGSRHTVVSTEEISIERPRAPGSKADESTSSTLDTTGTTQRAGFLMICRTCKKEGDHWTSKCPYKHLYPQTEETTSPDDDNRPPTADGAAASSSGAAAGSGSSSVFVPPNRRPGYVDKNGSGADAMRRRNDENSIRVSNLSEDAREPDLKELFERFGPLSRVYVATDRNTGESRGFGFVSFVYRQDGEEAIRKLDGYGYDNLILHVDWAAPRAN